MLTSSRIATLIIALVFILNISAQDAVCADEVNYLDASEIAAIGAASVAIFKSPRLFHNVDNTRHSLWQTPSKFETSISRFLGGEPRLGKCNFLDDDFGSVVTGLGTSVIMLGADAAWPADDRPRDILQDQYLLLSGLIATKGVTSIFKKLFARPRPIVNMAPDLCAQRAEPDYEWDNSSFFSGHTSSAFFSMTYLNKRLRSIMRREMTGSEYKDWRWLSPTLTLGWATYVGFSRVHAYKHYVSDVAAGAIAGYLMATLYYSLGNDLDNQSGGNQSPTIYRVTFRF